MILILLNRLWFHFLIDRSTPLDGRLLHSLYNYISLGDFRSDLVIDG